MNGGQSHTTPASESEPTPESSNEAESRKPAVTDESPDWDLIGAVAASEHRAAVLERLAESPATPSTIAEATGLDLSHVSGTLGDLRERGAVTLLVPEERRKGRLYDATDAGELVADRVADVGVCDGAHRLHGRG
ncbi:hypothetical protein ACFQFH_19965 [Halobaculum halobium]|uniref:HVO-A0261-like N-terminal domain-containing protein n=1 Tax=Halobaculum halobium TaxID=3032281 RepID=A0ABD5TB41_9EURY|nr:winged helix-turn-helix domain-containing protein [Halobaculum sp. SYNS20]